MQKLAYGGIILMLQFMGRENMEDYNADFLCMLETWEAAVKFAHRSAQNSKPIDIARLYCLFEKFSSSAHASR